MYCRRRAEDPGEGDDAIVNRNHLKLIACVSMLLDHMGILLFPHVSLFRWLGRIAMPLFAFFIGEGCRYTHDRKRYFLRLGALAAFCQIVFAADTLIGGGGVGPRSDIWFLNILFTFSVSCGGCFAVRGAKEAARRAEGKRAALCAGAFCLWLLAAGAFTWFAWRQRTFSGWALHMDYGISGLLLPVSAVLFDGPRRKRFAFLLALLCYCFIYSSAMPYVWFSLLSFPLLLCYNGQGGDRRFNKAFYLFYPAHLGALYLIALLIGRL